MLNYSGNADPLRNSFQQGGIQFAGLGISAGVGVFGGVVIGFLMKAVNKREMVNQFTDQNIVSESRIENKEEAAA